ncbi:DNA-binding CsgD family transcriptional regulator [Haloferula luteola]|uniref:DNA-binding CsgD family transcriptional regulator n=1 Tax=Haloferula luteola TaxID=595692 RepID=A0A840V8F1_9BACT|nr:LuxR C-terminal-related transcriptional regulator [Haloferula luteola]MBB5350230.1 DNA-binding CsgD family transcriptional regulator [Haloferula luteola]
MKGESRHWTEEEVRAVVGILGRSGIRRDTFAQRSERLLSELADWLEAEGWHTSHGPREVIRRGRPRDHGDEKFDWHDGPLRFSAHRTTPFCPRKSTLASILLRQCPWLAEALIAPEVSDAPPTRETRQAQVLASLIVGQSRKQIAERLGISINTVAGYVRDLYRVHGVSSQARLIQKASRQSLKPNL